MPTELENKNKDANTPVEKIQKSLSDIADSSVKTKAVVDEVAKHFGEDGRITKTEKAVKQLEEAVDTQTKKIANIQVGGVREKDNGGWDNLGEFALAVKNASVNGGAVDERLKNKAAPTTMANEATGGDGGFLVPQQWADQIMHHVFEDESIVSNTNQIPTTRNSLAFPRSEATPWSGTGVQANWTEEGNQIGQTKPVITTETMRLSKLAALVPATEELLEDAIAMEAFIGQEAAKAIRWKIDEAIYNGNGVGKPKGILQSGALVSVAKEVGQAADTLVAENVVKMYARMKPTSHSRAKWFLNSDVLPQLLMMTIGNQPVYLPPMGLADSPNGTLLGRPVELTQHAQTVGNQGDILYADMSEYLTLVKQGGVKTAASIHLFFDYDVTAFRFTVRIAGQTWMSAPITPANGSNTLSPFVTLAARA